MLNNAIINGVIRQSATDFTAAFPEISADIAIRAAEVEQRVSALLQKKDPDATDTALCFEICPSLDDVFVLPEGEVRDAAIALRNKAQHILLQKHYEAERTLHPERLLEISREESISGVLAEAVRALRVIRPHAFGPEWFRFELGKDVYDAFCEFAYDLQSDTIQWDAIAKLLPSDLRSAFDTRELGEIPEYIETDEQFFHVVEALERRGIKREDLLDAARLANHIRDVPGFQALLDYCERSTKTDD